MTDDSVQREIEANEARARDIEDVGVDENVLRQQQGDDGNLVTDATDMIFSRDTGGEDEDAHEFRDNTTSPST